MYERSQLLIDDYYSKSRKRNLYVVIAMIAITVITISISMTLVFTLISKNIIPEPPAIKPGIDGDLSLLYDKKIGLITNPSGVNHQLVATVDVLRSHSRIKLVSLFAPEYGLRGDIPPGQRFANYIDPVTKLPVYSLYNNNYTYAPSTQQLEEIDMLVFDLQDVGVRCFTYISTMAECLKAAKNATKPFVILDRINPIGALEENIQGPVMKSNFLNFIGSWTIPMQHAMTMGELARMFNDEMNIHHQDLYITKIRQVDPTQRSPDGISVLRKPLVFGNARWIPPSPNLPTLFSTAIYPGMVLFEATKLISLGRGTTTPFQLIGSPFIKPQQLIDDLNEMIQQDNRIKEYFKHVYVIPTYFIPLAEPYQNIQCTGVRLVMTHPAIYESTKSLPIAMTLLSALLKRYSATELGLNQAYLQSLMGVDELYSQLVTAKLSVPDIIDTWQKDLTTYKERRAKYLIY
jgi:uncharacterized protein YbbC (DUF1343 family)